jgi:hypothetical protein
MPYIHDPFSPASSPAGRRRVKARSPEQVKRRELRRRWNQGPVQPVVTRPGARFYVTIRDGARVGWLLGPYASHMTALSNVDRGRRMAMASRPDQAAFAAFGTASYPATLRTVFGR